MVSTDPNDPNFGLETDTTSPNFGLPAPPPQPTAPSSLTEAIFGKGAQAAVDYGQQQGAPTIEEQSRMVANIPAAIRNPLEAAAETVASFIPKTPQEALQFAVQTNPIIGPQYQASKIAQALGEGRSMEALAGVPVAQRIPEIQAAEETPAFSKERYKAGFGVLADIGMLAGLGARPKLTESIFGKTEAPPIQEPIVKPLISEQVAAEIPKEVTVNAEQISEPTQVHGDVLNAPRPQEGVGEMPAAVSGEGVPTRGQGQEVQKEVAPSVPQPERTFKVPSTLDQFGTEATPVSSYIMDSGGILSKSQAIKQGKHEGNAALWDDKASLKHPTHNKIYKASGEMPDVMANNLFNQGLIPEPTVGAMNRAIEQESGTSRALVKEGKAQATSVAESGQQFTDFENAKAEEQFMGKPPVHAGQLNVGDSIKIGDETLKVTNVDPDTFDVTLTDGRKYGVQHVADNEIIYGEHKPQTEPFSFEKPESVEEQKARMALESETEQAKAGKEEIQRRTNEPLVGTTGDIGQKGLFGEEELPLSVSKGKPAPVAEVPVASEGPPISTKNAYTEAQRVARGFPEAEQAAKRDFGTVWDEATAQAETDPNIGRRLVAELNQKPRVISDTENAHLLRTEIAAQTEHSAAVEAVNNAKTPEDLTAAKSRLELARQDLQDVYDATKRAGTKSGQALAARQMLAKEDYTLAAMEARRRAANNGLPLNEQQLAEVSALHEKITDLQSKLDAHEVVQKFNTEFARLVNETRKEARAAKSTTKFNDFMDRKADEARARIIERRGRLTTGFDPTMIADEAIIGASHIAKGITKFADWSVKMVDEFGDAVRPFLKDIWERAKMFHAETGKEYGEKNLIRYKTYLSRQTEQIKGKLEAGDFTKAERQRTKLDAEAFTMRANLQKLKNQFERGVAKEAYQKKSPAQKFWDHFVGVERAMKLSGPEVFGKLGVAAAAREAVLAPAESVVGYGASKLFPRLTAGTKFGADLATVIRAEIKAKAALFTKGIQDAAQNVAGKETQLEAIGDKYGRRPDFWYNRIGKMHAAIKAPVKRAEFTRSLEQRMNAAVQAGEDIHHPEVMTRLANEAVMDANRAIFQQNTVVSGFFSMLDRQVPVAGRVARFLFPVVKIPVNIFKEVLTYHAGAPTAAIKIGRAYLKGVETLPVSEREAIIRQLTKGSVGGAALLWGYFNSDKVRELFDNAPRWFNHTPIAMVLNEGSYLKKLEGTDPERKEGAQQLAHMAKTDIPFMYTITDITKAIDAHQSNAFLGWINNMVQSTVVPQILTQTAKNIDKPGSFPSNLSERPTYRVARNPLEAVKLGVPGLRETVPEKTVKQHKGRFKPQSVVVPNG